MKPKFLIILLLLTFIMMGFSFKPHSADNAQKTQKQQKTKVKIEKTQSEKVKEKCSIWQNIKKLKAPSLQEDLTPLINEELIEKPPKNLEVTSPAGEENEIPVKNTRSGNFCIKNPPPIVKPCELEKTDLRKIAKEASLELKDEECNMLGDLRILWQYAVENSETIKFAIYKLSDPKGDVKKADESKIKKLLKPISSITPFVAATTANPVIAGSSIISGTFLNDVLSEERYQKQLGKVTDADLVILAKAIEELQTNLVTTYYEYTIAKKVLEQTEKNLQNRKQLCDSLTNAPEQTVVIADTFYREALAKRDQAESNLLLKRTALEQLVGNEAILIVENNKKQAK